MSFSRRSQTDGDDSIWLMTSSRLRERGVRFQTVEMFHVTVCYQPSGMCWGVQSVCPVHLAGSSPSCFATSESCRCCCCRCEIFHMWRVQRMCAFYIWSSGPEYVEFATDDGHFPRFVFPDMQSFCFQRWRAVSSDLCHEDAGTTSCQSENWFVSRRHESILSTFLTGETKKSHKVFFLCCLYTK